MFYDGMDAASLFQLYEDTLRDQLDLLVPRHSVKSRSNLASPWFDEACRSMKRDVRRLERRYRRSREAADRLAWVTAIREKHYFFKTKENQYWERTITEQKSDSKKLWRTVSTVLGKPSNTSSSPPFTPSEFLSFLSSKVEAIRSATSGSSPPVFTPADCDLNSFDICLPDDVSRIIRASPSKSCDLDPVPTFLIKECLDVMLPFLTRLCNVSIQSGCLPTSQKTAMVSPRLKKSSLDPAEIQNYRPISNLPFMSKVIEKLILAQLSHYLAANNLFPKYQSGFRKYHSTETAILRVLSDIYSAIDQDQVSLLALLDVSAAFDTVDHGILLERLSTSYGLTGTAFAWLESNITGRVQVIHVGGRQSSPAMVHFGVPQGSVLGPVLYVLYTADIVKLVESFGLRAHLYADDVQLYGCCRPYASVDLSTKILQAIDSIHAWMSSNRLSLNTGKTQFIWFGTRNGLAKRDTHQLSNQSPSLVELTTVKNLGFTLDQELSTKDHVSKLCQSCYFQLRQIRTIRHSLSPSAIRTLVHAFICSRIDFSNSLIYGTSTYLLDRLQSVLNSSARLILKLGKYDPISAAIRRDLHWLPIQARIRFKMNAITRNCLVGQAPCRVLGRALPSYQRSPGEAQPTIGGTSSTLGPSFS